MATENEELPEEVEEEKKRPNPGDFYQQRLPAWQPVLNAWPVAWLFLGLGIFFLGFGIALFIIAQSIVQYTVDYTTCTPAGGSITVSGTSTTYTNCADFVNDVRATSNYQTCTCSVSFDVTSEIVAPVYMYYRLTNYYQNYRRYARSRDDLQLNGQGLTYSQLVSDNQCQAPFVGDGSLPYAPCGAVANSMFNDSLSLFYSTSTLNVTVPLLNTGIAWQSDKSVKFGNPSDSYWSASSSLKPPNWRLPVNQLFNESGNNAFTNEDLIVWMRTAALPTFRKLYRRVSHSASPFQTSLPVGKYILNVNYAYPVTSFGGTKSIVLTTSSWVGGRSLYIGVVYLAVGCVLLILSLVFFIIHLKMSKRIMAKIRGEEESGVTQTNGVATGRTEVSRTNTPGFFQMENGGQH